MGSAHVFVGVGGNMACGEQHHGYPCLQSCLIVFVSTVPVRVPQTSDARLGVDRLTLAQAESNSVSVRLAWVGPVRLW
jgi:hypothetical protein